MDTIIRDVRDIEATDRQALEHVIGRTLSEDQKVIFQIVFNGGQPSENSGTQEMAGPHELPAWCNVFDGLSDEEIGAVTDVIEQRANLTRSPE